MERCPTCGQPITEPVRTVDNPDEIVATLKARDGRELYRSISGTWHFTYGNDLHIKVNESVILKMVKDGILRSHYSDCPTEAYWLGRTIDVAATLEQRKKLGNKKLIVYA